MRKSGYVLTINILDETMRCMKQAYECGVNFFDTAER
jgi:aryl-alcohol dehydrogenase-like predicted oxidoreductase